jgi:hypothetical protein
MKQFLTFKLFFIQLKMLRNSSLKFIFVGSLIKKRKREGKHKSRLMRPSRADCAIQRRKTRLQLVRGPFTKQAFTIFTLTHQTFTNDFKDQISCCVLHLHFSVFISCKWGCEPHHLQGLKFKLRNRIRFLSIYKICSWKATERAHIGEACS